MHYTDVAFEMIKTVNCDMQNISVKWKHYSTVKVEQLKTWSYNWFPVYNTSDEQISGPAWNLKTLRTTHRDPTQAYTL